MRNIGAGKALLSALGKIAIDRDCGRLDWWCLDWNKSSIEFYKKMGAIPMDEWINIIHLPMKFYDYSSKICKN